QNNRKYQSTDSGSNGPSEAQELKKNPAGAGRASTLGQGETKTSPLQEVGGGWRPGQADRPTWSVGQARGPHRLNQGTWHFPVGSQRRFGVLRLVAPCYK